MVSLLYYALYKSTAEDDVEETSRLMSVHRYYYCFLGLFILLAGSLLSLFLPFLITGNTFDWCFVYKIYFIQLASVGITYFLVYRRTLFTVAQLGYVCIRIDGICTVIASILKIVVLYITRNYYLYLLIGLAYNVISNLVVSCIYRSTFPKIRKTKITWEYIKKRGFVRDLLNMSVGTIAGKVYFSTDSLVISKMLSINVAGLYSNYFMIFSAVDSLISKVLNGISPATGNFVNKETEKRIEELYLVMNLAFYFLGVFVASGFAVFFQPFILLWLGDEYLLPYSYVIAVSINAYVSWNHYFIAVMRGTQAHFEVDKWAYGLSAILNIIVSIVLAIPLGITGVAIGTIVGNTAFWVGRSYVVHKYLIKGYAVKYIVREVLKFIFACMQVVFIVFLLSDIVLGVGGLVIRMCFLLLYYAFIDLIVCLVLPEGHMLLSYLKRVVMVFVSRKKSDM